MREQDPKYTKIKIPETTRDDKIFSSMSLSHYGGPIPRKKHKKKVPEPLVTVNKVTQDQDDMNEESEVGSSIEVTKKTSVCVTPHKSGLTPPTYKNKRDYKGGTNDKTNDYHTPDSGVSRSDGDSVKRNLDEENNNAEYDEYIDHPPIKNDRINYQSHENIRKYYFRKGFQ